MSVKLLAEHHLRFLSLKEAASSSESRLVKMPRCWKSHVTAQLLLTFFIDPLLGFTDLLTSDLLPSSTIILIIY